MKTPCALLAGGLGALALLAGPVSPAVAAPGDTVATFTLAAGTLSVAVQPTAALTDGSAGAVLVTGNLGSVTVTDSRGGVLGWIASAASTSFVGSSGTESLAVTYTSGTITKTGVVTTTSSGTVALSSSPAPVVVGTLVLGNNTASWNPALSVTLPPASLAGTYEGTVTTSVL